MSEILNPFEEQPRRPIWKDLIKIEELIEKKMERIDESGSGFLAREEVLDQLRKRYNWYEKWAHSTLKDRIEWIIRSNKKQSENKKIDFGNLAEKNYETALNFFKTKDSKKEIDDGFNQIINKTIETSAKELDKILKLTENISDIGEAAHKFLLFIKEFKKQRKFWKLTKQEEDHFNSYNEIIESSIFDEDLLLQLLPQYIIILANIIRSKKNN